MHSSCSGSVRHGHGLYMAVAVEPEFAMAVTSNRYNSNLCPLGGGRYT
jgi:hypothetical protein